MLTYVQHTGSLYKASTRITTGYSGYEEGKNNPDMQSVHNKGPIPCGVYTIGPVHDSERTGKNVMNLTPDEGTETFGRDSFECHGDSYQHPGGASHGCIILSPFVRLQVVNAEPDRKIKVVAEETDVFQVST